jgi:hypothetical protein
MSRAGPAVSGRLKGWRFAFARFLMSCVGPKPLGAAVKKNAEPRSILTLSTNVRDPGTVLRNNYRHDLKRVKLRNFEEETEIKDHRSMMDSCPAFNISGGRAGANRASSSQK